MSTATATMGGTRRRLALFAAPAAALIAGAGGITTAHAAGQIVPSTDYVSTSGSDTSPCTQSLPCATLQHAVDTVATGGTVHVLAGTYNQTVNITKPLTLVGAGETSTIIDGSNIDTGAGLGTQDPTAPSSTPYYGVVSVQNNTGPGGAIKIRNLGIDHAFVTPLESSQLDDPSELSIYADANAGDTIAISEVTLGAVQDPADFGGIGLDVFNDTAAVSFFDGVSTGNFQGALLEGGGLGGQVTVTKSIFTGLVACAGACSGSSTIFPAEGLFVLSDQPGTATDTVSSNKFQGYAGFGIAVNAGYSGGNCTPPNGPCTGNVHLTANFNAFALGACASATDGCAAIDLDALTGNQLTALIKENSGTVRHPDKTIVEESGGGLYSVTEINNHIHVI
jgi:hypothetical protein